MHLVIFAHAKAIVVATHGSLDGLHGSLQRNDHRDEEDDGQDEKMPQPLVESDPLLSVALWDDVLEKLRPFKFSARQTPCVRWLVSTEYGDNTVDTWRRRSEALDVLALLGRVAPHAWRREMTRLGWTGTEEWGATTEDEPFEIGIEVRADEPSKLDALAKHMLDLDRPTTGYLDAKRRIETAFRVEHRVSLSNLARPRIPLLVKVESDGHDGRADTIVKTLCLVSAQFGVRCLSEKNHQRGGTSARCEIAELKLDEWLHLSHVELRCLRKLAEYGVLVRNISYLNTEITILKPTNQGEAVCDLVEDLQGLIAGFGFDDEAGPTHRFDGIHKLALFGEYPRLMLSLTSAAQVSRSLDTLSIQTSFRNVDDFDDLDLWRCVAYGILSRHAEHNISRLELTLDHFNRVYMNAIRDVLAGRPPLSHHQVGAGIFDCLVARPPKRLTCTRVHLFHPSVDVHASYSIDYTKLMDLRVIEEAASDGDDSDSLLHSVLLPGWGKAWARGRLSVCPGESDPGVRDPLACRSFREVRIYALSGESMLPAVDFLKLIGANLADLYIDDAEYSLSVDDWLYEVFHYVPRLCKLTIQSVQIDSLDELIDGLMAANLHLEELVLECDIAVSNVNQLCRFFDALGTSHHVLGAHLKELRLLLPRIGETSTAMTALNRALGRNRQLHTLHIQLKNVDRLDERRSIEQLLSPSLQTPPMCRISLFSFSGKLALLSAIFHPEQPLLVLQRFDVSVLTKVFELAAPGRVRDFQVKFSGQATE